MKSLIQYRKTERFLMLYSLYRKSNGMSNQAFNMRDLAYAEGIGLRSYKASFDFLCKEGLIKPQVMGGDNGFDFSHACLTDEGIFVVEEVFRDEMKETQYFPSYREMMM